jgi:hypothetical protein
VPFLCLEELKDWKRQCIAAARLESGDFVPEPKDGPRLRKRKRGSGKGSGGNNSAASSCL